MKKSLKVILSVTTIFVLSGFMRGDSDIYFQMSKGIDIFGRIYKEIAINYVDEVKPTEFMLEGIKGMLKTLDPYTVYIDENHQQDIDIITSGKYGGIGTTVGVYNDKITVIDLIEGYSAQRQGIRIGDVIKKVDTVEVSKENYNELGKYLKRTPGTEISITIEREGLKEDLIFNLVSEEIEIKNLTYYGFVPENSNNAYLKLSGFSRTAGDEIRKALQELKVVKDIKSVVLDLRGNPGGLLEAAVDVSEKFLSQDNVIVTIIGRDDKKKQVYKAKEKPVAKDVELVVLVDHGSASASEIVAGAIQDHDRGIILGTKSFGKGLVQTVIPLSFNTSLKMTTARYYTPSGRCIQEVDYTKDKNVFEEFSKINNDYFYTDNKREVLAGGGILPDTIVTNLSESKLVKNLLAKGMFFKFGTYYYNTTKEKKLQNINKDKLFKKFEKYITEENFTYKTESETLLNELKENFNKEKLNASLIDDIEKLEEKLASVKEKELIKYKDDIVAEIKQEISARQNGRKGRIIESLKNDEQFETAIEILKNKNIYSKILEEVN